MMVQFKYAESRLSALRMYLGDENTTIEQELISYLDRLWEQKIPEDVRDYIERSEKQRQQDKPRDSRRVSGPKKPVSGVPESEGADDRDDGEKAT
jgi:hypothetical protein